MISIKIYTYKTVIWSVFLNNTTFYLPIGSKNEKHWKMQKKKMQNQSFAFGMPVT